MTTSTRDPRRVAVIAYDGLCTFEFAIAVELFGLRRQNLGVEWYDFEVCSLERGPIRATGGILVEARRGLRSLQRAGTIVIPGWRKAEEPPPRSLVKALRDAHAEGARLVSICSGVFVLAATGLLDGKRVTTHWKFSRDVAQRFPLLHVDANAIFIKAGKFYTAAGITAGIDLALALIEEDHGSGMALSVARELVVYLKRPGGQEQYSEPLQFQARCSDRLSELAPWISGHLGQSLSVEALAERVCLSPRHFTRRFRQAFGVNPGEFVEKLRLDEARHRLTNSLSTIEGVADSVGFGSADSFRRAFERRFGVAPSVYRGRFTTV
jgi:AraC family transcriptional regulator, transcriptional activator FtrA